MVAATLQTIDAWYKEDGKSADESKLLSKLATIELCGWLELQLDRLIYSVDAGKLNDKSWCEKHVINATAGFEFEKHFRPMLCRLVGEIFARRVEAAMEIAHPGEFERFVNALKDLWRERCSYAHADLTSNLTNGQLKFHAPSLTIGKHTDLVDLLSKYESALIAEMAKI